MRRVQRNPLQAFAHHEQRLAFTGQPEYPGAHKAGKIIHGRAAEHQQAARLRMLVCKEFQAALAAQGKFLKRSVFCSFMHNMPLFAVVVQYVYSQKKKYASQTVYRKKFMELQNILGLLGLLAAVAVLLVFRLRGGG
jgi:hypothetical protein